MPSEPQLATDAAHGVAYYTSHDGRETATFSVAMFSGFTYLLNLFGLWDAQTASSILTTPIAELVLPPYYSTSTGCYDEETSCLFGIGSLWYHTDSERPWKSECRPLEYAMKRTPSWHLSPAVANPGILGLLRSKLDDAWYPPSLGTSVPFCYVENETRESLIVSAVRRAVRPGSLFSSAINTVYPLKRDCYIEQHGKYMPLGTESAIPPRTLCAIVVGIVSVLGVIYTFRANIQQLLSCLPPWPVNVGASVAATLLNLGVSHWIILPATFYAISYFVYQRVFCIDVPAVLNEVWLPLVTSIVDQVTSAFQSAFEDYNGHIDEHLRAEVNNLRVEMKSLGSAVAAIQASVTAMPSAADSNKNFAQVLSAQKSLENAVQLGPTKEDVQMLAEELKTVVSTLTGLKSQASEIERALADSKDCIRDEGKLVQSISDRAVESVVSAFKSELAIQLSNIEFMFADQPQDVFENLPVQAPVPFHLPTFFSELPIPEFGSPQALPVPLISKDAGSTPSPVSPNALAMPSVPSTVFVNPKDCTPSVKSPAASRTPASFELPSLPMVEATLPSVPLAKQASSVPPTVPSTSQSKEKVADSESSASLVSKTTRSTVSTTPEPSRPVSTFLLGNPPIDFEDVSDALLVKAREETNQHLLEQWRRFFDWLKDLPKPYQLEGETLDHVLSSVDCTLTSIGGKKLSPKQFRTRMKEAVEGCIASDAQRRRPRRG
ncbi:hypothetical protein CYLTODRAFT_492395 [Cylindrobasidium torrendii FP15055 ss-10]|uniref:Uncharacterized protein n=1 Tax=Cylindrobasidium torrendii FP15055 ss-10 TaxID=1314674 RepID=A0A0D7B583_9AGAR|nr:hypothetical protein CYLTODRAFT_492395 [Cylindrobasidium torrendii FP15055 ss-10]